MARGDSISSLVDRLELNFNALGGDPYGISKRHLVRGFSIFGWLYRNYFRVRAVGAAHIPPRGRAMLVGNHSGGYAIDGAMVLASALLELDPPRLAQGMAEKFINQLPLGSSWSYRTGQFTGTPETAERLLEDVSRLHCRRGARCTTGPRCASRAPAMKTTSSSVSGWIR